MMELSLVQTIAVWILPVLFAITVHEVAHGWVALQFGDQTARFAGRLTLNPIKHIDIIGTIVVPFLLLLFSHFIFGWAKPVPVDFRNLRHPRWSVPLVALAGPFANFIMALLWALFAKAGFALMSMPWLGVPMVLMGKAGILINVVLGVLNCLPIPPLDGGRAICSVLPGRWSWKLQQFEHIGFFLLLLLLMTGILSNVLGPIVYSMVQWISAVVGIK